MTLEVINDFNTFLDLFKGIIDYYLPQLERWEEEGYDMYDAKLKFNRKIKNAINRFSKNLVNSLQQVSNIVEKLDASPGIIKSYFAESELGKNMEHVFEIAAIYKPENLPLFKSMFISFKANLTYLSGVKMQKLISRYYRSKTTNFNELYEYLLRDWNDIEIIKKCINESIKLFMEG